jgi:hypothetical protein
LPALCGLFLVIENRYNRTVINFKNFMKKIIFSFAFFILLFFLFPSFIQTKSCPLPTQKPYSPDTATTVYYLTKNCTKRAFSNSKKYLSYFSSWKKVRQVSAQKLAQIPQDPLGFMPWGPRKDFRSGTLVKTTKDPKVYVILNNEKCWLKNLQVFNKLNYKMDWVVDVSPKLINNLPTCSSPIGYTDHHPPGTLVKYSDSPNVYQIKKHHNKSGELAKDLIKSEQEFNQLGYRWDRIITVPESETYPNYSEVKRQSNQTNNPQNNSSKSSSDSKNKTKKNTTSEISETKINYQGDGSYRLREGELALADNNIGIKIRDIHQLTDKQKQKFGEDIFWMKVDFYLNKKKLNLLPVRFSGTYRAKNSNTLYGLDIGYNYEKDYRKKGEQYVNIDLNSIASNINSCQDLVQACQAKDRKDQLCKRKYCATEAVSGETKTKDEKFMVITPDEINEIGNDALSQMKACYSKIKNYLGFAPVQDRVVMRVHFGRGAAKTSNFGIFWPINKNKQKQELEKFRQNPNSCSNELLAHEMVHYFVRGVPIDDVYHEGAANFIAQDITSADASDITCKANGWSGNSAKSHVSQVQAQCYNNCLSSCYTKATQIEFKENTSQTINGNKVIFKQIEPKKFWPNTNETGAYHGSMKLIIKDDNGQVIDQENMYVGNVYSKHGIKIVPTGIAVQKTIYPDRTEKTDFVRVRSYTGKNNSNKYCNSSCTNICRQRASESVMKYSDLDQYKQVPWQPTYKMFYHSSQCIFEKIDTSDTKRIIQAGKTARDKANEMCLGGQIKQTSGEPTYDNINNIFDIGSACFWKVQRVGNVDCWNQSCRKNIGIK